MDSEPEVDDFYFESDHVALRGNQDYSNILRTIAQLESCKIRVHQQLQELDLAKQKYLINPELLLNKIKNKESIVERNEDLHIPELPNLIGTYEYLKAESLQHEAGRRINHSKPPTVRGRILDETKPETFNKLWTCEEQRRLEQLLIEFPPEQKEMRRYTKIAQALGNRTPQQVSSRVQKYFQKLQDAGMPIPGRKPKSRRNPTTKLKYFQKPTTFFPSYNVRVSMPEDDEFEADDLRMSMHSSNLKIEDNESTDEILDNDLFSPPDNELERKKQNDKKLFILKELRCEKEKCGETYQPDPMASLCVVCNVTAVTLKRWLCRTCHIYINYCIDCFTTQIITNKFLHISHDLVAEE